MASRAGARSKSYVDNINPAFRENWLTNVVRPKIRNILRRESRRIYGSSAPIRGRRHRAFEAERAGDVEAVRRAFAVGFDPATPDVERPHGSSDRQGPRS
jgi:hypothetical protein